ncbi:MAG: RHS repeat-associated core domain-containing protein, partial [Clostridia bacterium]|nr:RHS repeat-associated core domain-containing protein [Clostridia bacterium]
MTALEKGSDKLLFSYDSLGNVIAVNFNGTYYYYIRNLQGDIIGILDSNMNYVVEYSYDTWGKLISTTGSLASTLGTLNPFRYRGYVYDTETGLYYVSSRYYDPEIGRWISPEPNVYAGAFDSSSGLIGYNVYAYCANNPVNYYDPTGEFVISTLLICVAAGAIIGGTIGGIAGNAYANSKGYTGWDKTKSILTGIGIGGLAGGALGYFAAPAVVSA